MKIKTLVAVLLLSGGVTSVLAQEDCNKNSSISHEAVRANNFKDAYLPWKEVLKDCPTLRYYTYTDGIKILTSFFPRQVSIFKVISSYRFMRNTTVLVTIFLCQDTGYSTPKGARQLQAF